MKKLKPATPQEKLDLQKMKEIVMKEQKKIRKEVMEKMLNLATTAFGLVAALAWNDAVKALFEKVFGTAGEQIVAKFWYALIVTTLVVVVTVYLSRMLNKEEKGKGN